MKVYVIMRFLCSNKKLKGDWYVEKGGKREFKFFDIF